MKFGSKKDNKKDWTYKGRPLRNPIWIMWNLILVVPYLFFLFGLALLTFLITFNANSAKTLIKEKWPF